MAHKRLIVCCDGTWQDSDNGFVRDSWLPWKTSGHLATPTNVTRICRALLPRSRDGVQQVVYYQAGVGSLNNWYSFFLGGYLGQGISENIREAYGFLCNNYEEGDEIVLAGFSRGAFTARSIGALIAEVGLLTKHGMSSFYPIFKDWQNQVNEVYLPQYGTSAWPDTRPHFTDPAYLRGLVEGELTRPNIPVKAVAVWDTVGVLGVPDIEILGVKLYSAAHREYSFVNTEVPSNVENAYHALALDEQRKPYSPALWEWPQDESRAQLQVLKQCWFPGVHASVGGGYSDTSISDITLAWIITQLSRHVELDPAYIIEQQKLNEQFYMDHKVPVASWGLGAITRSDAGLLNTVLGRKVRTPGEYCVIDPATGRPTSKRLSRTCEFIHPSVRYRIQQAGPGLAASASAAPNGVYAPKALAGWVYHGPNEPWRDTESLGIGKEAEVWDGHGKWVVERKVGATYIVEEMVEGGTAEMALLQAWPGVEEKVLGVSGGGGVS